MDNNKQNYDFSDFFLFGFVVLAAVAALFLIINTLSVL